MCNEYFYSEESSEHSFSYAYQNRIVMNHSNISMQKNQHKSNTIAVIINAPISTFGFYHSFYHTHEL